METVIATEGVGEFRAFKTLFSSLHTSNGVLSPKILRVGCQPDGPPKGIAKACVPLMKQASARNADLFVLVIDREQQGRTPGDLAAAVKTELRKVSPGSFCIEVVYKDRTFENWLVADLDALRKQRARYDVTQSISRAVEPNKADNVKALDILKKAAKGKQYDKIVDGQNIANSLNLINAARHSRSLRHLLHVLGHVRYENQCKKPAD